MKARLGLAVATPLIAVAAACNGILGIDAPKAVTGDAGANDSSLTDTASAADSRDDAAIDASPDRGDAALEGAPNDGPPSDVAPEGGPGGFDGHCGCDDAGCQAIVVAAGQNSPVGIAADMAGVYWTNAGDGTVQRIVFPGPPEVVTSVPNSSPSGLAMTAATVAWVEAAGGRILACSRPACSGPQVVAMGLPQLGSIAVDTGNAYFNTGRNIDSCLLSGGAPAAIVTGTMPDGVITDGQNLYWIDGAAVVGCALPGCPGGGTQLASAESAPQGLSVAGGTLYWTNSLGAVRTCTASSCSPTTLFQQGAPSFVVSDGTNVYWTDAFGGHVVRGPVGGGATVVIASSQMPRRLALGDTCVFFVDNPFMGAGSIIAVAK